MPNAPTPGPPSSACSSRASERSQPATGVVSPSASLVNSLLTHSFGKTFANTRGVAGSSGVPNRCGITTLKPAATTSSPNAITSGVIPGISWISTTAGPLPLR